jgi:hypothetical protein
LNSCALEAEIGLPQCETGFGSARGTGPHALRHVALRQAA